MLWILPLPGASNQLQGWSSHGMLTVVCLPPHPALYISLRALPPPSPPRRGGAGADPSPVSSPFPAAILSYFVKQHRLGKASRGCGVGPAAVWFLPSPASLTASGLGLSPPDISQLVVLEFPV